MAPGLGGGGCRGGGPCAAATWTAVGEEQNALTWGQRLRVVVRPTDRAPIDTECHADDHARGCRNPAHVLDAGRKGDRAAAWWRGGPDGSDGQVDTDAQRHRKLVVAPVDVVEAIHVVDPRLDGVEAGGRDPRPLSRWPAVGGQYHARPGRERLGVVVRPAYRGAVNAELHADDHACRSRGAS